MKRSRWGWIEYLAVVPVLCLVPGRSAAAAEPDLLGPLNAEMRMDWGRLLEELPQEPALEAADPVAARNRSPYPVDAEQPRQREREAVLPDPVNGWELVDRILAPDMRGQLILLGTNQATGAQGP
jgi:hypothetical protein